MTVKQFKSDNEYFDLHRIQEQKEREYNAFKDGYKQAIDDCLLIAKKQRNSWNGGSWTVREIEELKESVNNDN